MARLRHICWVFFKHLYTVGILLASDPFDIAERWFKLNYSPPPWLFWILLATAIVSAVVLTIRELRTENQRYNVARLPNLLDEATEYLRNKTVKILEKAQKNVNIPKVSEVHRVLARSATIFGFPDSLPKPKSLPVTKRYRKSIEKRIPVNILDDLKDRDKGLIYEAKIGGVLDSEGYGLQLSHDRHYQRLRREIISITRHYLGKYSNKLTESVDNVIARMYASYSFALFSGYWEILVNFAKHYGQLNLVTPEAEALASLKYEAIDKYLNEEIEQAKHYVGLALESPQVQLNRSKPNITT
jgi:hypothetical protein